MKTTQQILGSQITEKEFTNQVIQLLKLCGFDLVYHTWTAVHSPRGFPDIVTLRVRDKRLCFIELKSERGQVTLDQTLWINALKEMGCEVYVWRPSEWDSIVQICQKEKEG